MENRNSPLLFSGSSHHLLAEEIATILNVKPGRVFLTKFPDGESSVQILDNVLNRTVFVLQSLALEPNNYLMELLLMVDALKRGGAKTICAIIPYFGYSRQDRKDQPGVPITAKLVAAMLSTAGITHLITCDLHSGQLEGFFEIPVFHEHCQKLLTDRAVELIDKNFTVVEPDLGSIKMIKKLSHLNTNFVVIDKQRISPTEVKMNLLGNLSTESVLIVDDICSTAGTLVAAASLLKSEYGVKQIVVAVTHAVCCGDALEKIESSPIETLIVTNTIPFFDRFSKSSKVVGVSIAPLIANTIKSICGER